MDIEVAGFEIEREIGRGGFGIVYLARQLAFDRPAAIKVLRPGVSADELQKRFTQECRAVGALRSHPNVLTVYSTGLTADGMPYLAMQYLGGGSLSDRLPLPPADAAALGVRLADGLTVAHAGGVVHRDVKPSNILFGDDNEPVLVDFGISSLMSEANTTTGDVAVSIGYTPPEILGGARPTVAADVYSLGATLFAMLTGRAPFVNESGFTSIAVLAHRILTATVEDLRPTGVPDALCAVIERCMAKEPAERFASMAQLRAALVPIAADDTVRQSGAVWDLAPAVASTAAPTAPRVPIMPGATTRHRRIGLAVAAVVLLGAGVAAAVAQSSGSDPAPRASVSSGVAAGAAASGPGTRPAGPAGSVGAKGVIGLGGAPGPTSGSRSTRPPARITTTVVGGQTIVVQGGGAIEPPVGTVPQSSRARSTSATAPAKRTNHAPTLGGLSDRTTGEQTSVSTSLTGSDADPGDSLRFTMRNLPPGLSYTSSGSISGTIPWSALDVTTNYRSIASRSWTVAVTLTDSHGGTDTGSFTWTIRDTYFRLDNYYGKYGCNGDPGCSESVPNVDKLGSHAFPCVVDPSHANQIVDQSPAAGSIVSWGSRFSFTYANDSC
ncbi:MAG: protein kinase [Jatrophihabitans sp.]